MLVFLFFIYYFIISEFGCVHTVLLVSQKVNSKVVIVHDVSKYIKNYLTLVTQPANHSSNMRCSII